MSGAPSPTVNTQEALRLVMGMFNGSLDLDKSSLGADVHMEEPSEPPKPAGMLYYRDKDIYDVYVNCEISSFCHHKNTFSRVL